VTCINVAITGGQFISCLVAGALSDVPQGWRYMLGLSAVPAMFQLLGFLYIPESPRWLADKNRIEDAERALRSIRNAADDLQAELTDILASVPAADLMTGKTKKNSIKDMFSKKNLFRALFLGCMLQACQQLSGINTVMYYSATILKTAGFSSSSAIWLSAVTAFCNLLGSIAGLLIVDRAGRRPLTLISLFCN
jgi:MFS transporter, SP family, solute carrier family 2 (myo-inositol transporter), member 13